MGIGWDKSCDSDIILALKEIPHTKDQQVAQRNEIFSP
jgi:hypothetical protein